MYNEKTSAKYLHFYAKGFGVTCINHTPSKQKAESILDFVSSASHAKPLCNAGEMDHLRIQALQYLKNNRDTICKGLLSAEIEYVVRELSQSAWKKVHFSKQLTTVKLISPRKKHKRVSVHDEPGLLDQEYRRLVRRMKTLTTTTP